MAESMVAWLHAWVHAWMAAWMCAGASNYARICATIKSMCRRLLVRLDGCLAIYACRITQAHVGDHRALPVLVPVSMPVPGLATWPPERPQITLLLCRPAWQRSACYVLLLDQARALAWRQQQSSTQATLFGSTILLA
eukprot:109330-Chlamydomonas_euryale.AAC.2